METAVAPLFAGRNRAADIATTDDRPLAAVEAMVLNSASHETTSAWLNEVERTLLELAAYPRAGVKFLVLDLTGARAATVADEERLAGIAGLVAGLVLQAPVIPIAYVHGRVSETELALAFACSMIVAEADAVFGFDGDLLRSAALYALLAQRVGFVRAERLIGREAPTTAAEMAELLLVKEVIAAGAGLAGLSETLRAMLRRYNSSFSIYRAQRIAAPLPERIFSVGRRGWAGSQAA